jgi:predicted ribosomally synthesized peptide with nif11-like leader
MSQMKELYQKVSEDSVLQAKFADIMKDAEQDDQEATGEKLVAFAKEAGYGVTIEEMKEYFKDLSEKQSGELTETELDMVAGGKFTGRGIGGIIGSVVGLVIGCVLMSVTDAATGGNCYSIFDVTK